jgi:hypothetical protein
LVLLAKASTTSILETTALEVMTSTAATITTSTAPATSGVPSNVWWDSATDGWYVLADSDRSGEAQLPFDETPAPISISGSSMTMPPWRG